MYVFWEKVLIYLISVVWSLGKKYYSDCTHDQFNFLKKAKSTAFTVAIANSAVYQLLQCACKGNTVVN